MIQEPDELDSAVAEPNSNVEGLRVEWDFQENTWNGEFLSGPLVERVYTCGPENFTKNKWNRLVTAGRVQGSFEEATGDQIEQACLKFLELHCQTELTKAVSVCETP